MLYMVIENFNAGAAVEIYCRVWELEMHLWNPRCFMETLDTSTAP
jgi:hypothetical protein